MVEQANLFNFFVAYVVVAGLIGLLMAGDRRVAGIQSGIAVGFGAAALFFIVPFNPFRGFAENRRHAGRTALKDLDESELRVLREFYEPRARRRAVLAVAAVAISLEVIWLVSLALRDRPIARSVFPEGQLAFAIAGLALPLALWAGLYGLTSEMRKHWKDGLRGAAWPIEEPFPGSLHEAVRSFFAGSLPVILRSDIANEADQRQEGPSTKAGRT